MKKIICDYCGTTFAENAPNCPICGMAKSGDPQIVETDENDAAVSDEYHYVKGGRFSKANVRKRNKMMEESAIAESVEQDPIDEEPEEDDEEVEVVPPKKKKNVGLIIAIVVLALAIVAVGAFIVLRFINPGLFGGSGASADTTAATEKVVPCESVTVTNAVIELKTAGSAQLVNVSKVPANTTDELKFSSADTKIATVTATGKVQAVSGGTTTITVTCGKAKTTFEVRCTFETATEPTEKKADDVDIPSSEFRLNREDVTFQTKGSTWVLYGGKIPASAITWKSDDEKVVTVKDGKVEAVGGGKAVVTATYKDVTQKCIFRCAFTDKPDNDIGSGGGISEEGAEELNISPKSDITLSLSGNGNQKDFRINLQNKMGANMQVRWSSQNTDICTVESDNHVLAAGKGIGYVSCEYNGKTYTCTVRVTD